MEFRICFLQQNVTPNWQRAPKRQDMSTIRLRVGGTERGVSGSTFCVGFLGMIENRVSGIKTITVNQSNHHILDNWVSRQFYSDLRRGHPKIVV